MGVRVRVRDMDRMRGVVLAGTGSIVVRKYGS